MFMITASAALSSIITTVSALAVVIDNEHRVRNDRIYSEKLGIWKKRDDAANAVYQWVKSIVKDGFKGRRDTASSTANNGDGQRLLG
jgi:hypothetical protein